MFKPLTNATELDELFTMSGEKPIVIFKHSNSCPISHDVRDGLISSTQEIFEIVVQEHRELSNTVAEKTGIKHESPQALVIFNGNVIYKASHYDIIGSAILSAMNLKGD
jgi:thioredoxin 1